MLVKCPKGTDLYILLSLCSLFSLSPLLSLFLFSLPPHVTHLPVSLSNSGGRGTVGKLAVARMLVCVVFLFCPHLLACSGMVDGGVGGEWKAVGGSKQGWRVEGPSIFWSSFHPGTWQLAHAQFTSNTYIFVFHCHWRPEGKTNWEESSGRVDEHAGYRRVIVTNHDCVHPERSVGQNLGANIFFYFS